MLTELPSPPPSPNSPDSEPGAPSPADTVSLRAYRLLICSLVSSLPLLSSISATERGVTPPARRSSSSAGAAGGSEPGATRSAVRIATACRSAPLMSVSAIPSASLAEDAMSSKRRSASGAASGSWWCAVPGRMRLTPTSFMACRYATAASCWWASRGTDEALPDTSAAANRGGSSGERFGRSTGARRWPLPYASGVNSDGVDAVRRFARWLPGMGLG